MHLYIVSGILLIVPIVDFALAAPVQVQERRQACADMADIPVYPTTLLGKRGGISEIEEVGGKYIENWFVPKGSPAAHVSSSSAASESGQVKMSTVNAPAPNPGPPTEPAHLLTGMHAPLSSPVHPTYFRSDKELLRAHGSQPNTGPSNPSTVFNSDNRLVVEEPPSSAKGPSRWSRFEMGPVPSSSQVSSTDTSRQAKKSRRNSLTARDFWDTLENNAQPKWSNLAPDVPSPKPGWYNFQPEWSNLQPNVDMVI